MATAYEGSHQQYGVIRQADTMAPMRDGTGLATDIYLPAIAGLPAQGQFPVVLERTPYNKASPPNVTNGICLFL